MTMTERLKQLPGEAWMILACLVLLVACFVGLAYAINAAEDDCTARGGHLVTDTGTVVTPDGKVGTSSTYTCYTSDGRRL